MRPLLAIFNSILFRIFSLTFGLFLVTLIIVIIAMQTPLSGRVFDTALEESSQSIAELVWLLETSPRQAEDAILSIYSSQSQVAIVGDGFPSVVEHDGVRRDLLVGPDTAVSERLRSRDIRFKTLGLFELRELLMQNPLRPYNSASALQIAIELEDSRVLNLWIGPSIFFTRFPFGLIILIGLIAVVTLVLGLAIHWVIMRPIRILERDAELVGLAETAVPVSETGPRELRRLTSALNRMRTRLAGLIREREHIMVAIAHDVRTGLTKLRLRMEGHESVAATAIEPELDQMEKLLSDMMAYARAEHPVAEHELIELSAFAKKLAENFPCKIAILTDEFEADFTIAGSRIAITRLFENLLENARRYGGGEITMRLLSTSEGLAVHVEDNGPGIPPDDLGQAFEPFFRAERSRNRNTGGTGLGLGIARAIAHTHGASISLFNLDTGGLCARVFFPVRLRA